MVQILFCHHQNGMAREKPPSEPWLPLQGGTFVRTTVGATVSQSHAMVPTAILLLPLFLIITKHAVYYGLFLIRWLSPLIGKLSHLLRSHRCSNFP